MERSETEIRAKKERDRDKRYRQLYYIGLDEYNRIGEAQGWRCGVCGRHASEFTAALNVDHFHFKIQCRKLQPDDPAHQIGMKWYAYTTIDSACIGHFSKTKAEAVRLVKKDAMPKSIRGLLCPGRHTGCNRLMGRIDRPAWLRRVIDYLDHPPAREALLTIQKIYDPPNGWRYGFPKPYIPLLGETIEQTLLRDGYPQEEISQDGAKHVRFWTESSIKGAV